MVTGHIATQQWVSKQLFFRAGISNLQDLRVSGVSKCGNCPTHLCHIYIFFFPSFLKNVLKDLFCMRAANGVLHLSQKT